MKMKNNRWSLILIVFITLLLFFGAWRSIQKTGPEPDVTEPEVSTAIQGQEIPDITDIIGYVNDEANVFNIKELENLAEKLTMFADSGIGKIAVLTIRNIDGLSIDEFAIRVAEKWEVGDAEGGNGVIIVLSSDERKVRIQIGRGVPITDAQASQILDEVMVPSLDRAEWAKAFNDGVDAVISLMSK